MTKVSEPPRKFKDSIVDVLRGQPKRFKEIYLLIAERHPGDCPAFPSRDGKKVNITNMEWLQEVERALQEVAVNCDGIWHLKEQFVPRFSSRPVERTEPNSQPSLESSGQSGEAAEAEELCAPSTNVASESKANSKRRKHPVRLPPVGGPFGRS
jgi:hypothetical protein